jgi:probable DNA repair protein
LTCVRELDELRSELPRKSMPSAWASRIHELLEVFGWPRSGALDSRDFQLLNAWRELLNAFARLDLVSQDLTAGEAVARLAAMAGETMFQPESEGAVVDLMGPLEAAGMQFDKLWICGLDAEHWPPPGRPLTLVSRALQREYGMPDAEPQDTLDYAHRILERLTASAAEHVCSYALADGDAQQTGTGLLAHYESVIAEPTDDPGWNAMRQVGISASRMMHSDPVPSVGRDETISGGASSLQRQFEEPFAAFAYGRLGIRPMYTIVPGLSASLRGSLIHDAMYRLYRDRPTQADIDAWRPDQLQERIVDAVQGAFGRHYRNADPVLRALLDIETERVRNLLRGVVELDRSRDAFTVLDAETPRALDIDGLRLQLRVDRIDRLEDGELVILDYKTGRERRFLSRDGRPNDLQLVIYACAVEEPVSDLGLVNIDSRSIGISGAGRTFTPDLDWANSLQDWRNEVEAAAEAMSRGDVRINGLQSRQAARPLALLSRIAELRRDD